MTTEPFSGPPLFGPQMPIPGVDADTGAFWDACREHRLVVQQCDDCGAFRFAPLPVCHACRSSAFTWVESAGIGEVYTWTVVHHPVHPATRDSVPYGVVVVELLDCGGAKVVSNLVDVAPEEIEAGMRVEVVWDVLDAGPTVPRFRRAA